MKRSNLLIFGFAGLVATLAGQMACSPIGARGTDQCDGVFVDDECIPDNAGNGGAGQTSTGNGNGGDGGCLFGNCNPSASGGSGGSGAGSMCSTDPNVDDDKDGASENQGDCNDCDPNVGPGAIEVATDPMNPMAQPSDEDCDGTVDNVADFCDQNLALDDVDANNGARAVDLCHFSKSAVDWGVIQAMYVRSNGAPAAPGQQVGLFDNFGPNVNVQGGGRMLGIASGTARLPGQPGACGLSTCSSGNGQGTPPAGFPQDPPNCTVSTSIYDDVGLEVHLRAPTNATGYKFSFKFYSFEYPEWVCQSFNDQFISLINPPPMGSINGNISFDVNKNPVSVNVAFFTVCDPDATHPCPDGPSQMLNTGFNTWNNAGGTAWLQSQAPVTGGQELIIRWAIWDTGDSAFDSTALVDNFQWIANGGTVVVGTTPIPTPK